MHLKGQKKKYLSKELGKDLDRVTEKNFKRSLPVWTVTLQPEIQMSLNVH